MHALNDLSSLDNSPAWPLVNHLFYQIPLPECFVRRDITPINQNLNESQVKLFYLFVCLFDVCQYNYNYLSLDKCS